jgi:hypothetical protein
VSSYPERLPACHCWGNARLMVQRHPELRYVEGHLVWSRPYAWTETPDGQIIDPTGWAYEHMRPLRYERRDRADRPAATRAGPDMSCRISASA